MPDWYLSSQGGNATPRELEPGDPDRAHVTWHQGLVDCIRPLNCSDKFLKNPHILLTRPNGS